MGSRTVWLWLFVASLGVTALLGVVALLTPGVPFQEQVLVTSALLTIYSLLALVATFALTQTRYPKLVWAASVCLASSLVIWLVLTWFDPMIGWSTESLLEQIGATVLIGGMLLLHNALLLMVRLAWRVSKVVRTATLVAAALGVALVLGLFWGVRVLLDHDLAGRIAAALLIPAALGAIAVPVLARIEHLGGVTFDDESIDRFVEVSMTCPRCAGQHRAIANRKCRCHTCGLELTVSFKEPRCDCGYLLYGLPEPVCPECGRAVPDERLWESHYDADTA